MPRRASPAASRRSCQTLEPSWQLHDGAHASANRKTRVPRLSFGHRQKASRRPSSACQCRRGLPVLRQSAGGRFKWSTCKRSLEILAWLSCGPCRKVALEQIKTAAWGGRVVEGKSQAGQGAPQRRARCAAGPAVLNPCASGHRSNPSSERTASGGLRRLQPQLM